MRLAITGNIDHAVFDLLLRQCEPCLSGADAKLDIDLSSAEFGTPTGLVPFAALLRLLKSRGVDVNISEYPTNPSTCGYYCRMDFFKQVGVDTPVQTSRNDGAGKFIEITELPHPEITEEVAKKLKRLLQKLPKGVEATEEARSSFIDASGELVSNTRHGYNSDIEADVERKPKALLQAQFYPKNEVVSFCVCDCGIGIKRSMEGAGPGMHSSHLDAIDAALALRNKGDNSDGKGLGLATLQSFVRRNGGILSIRSGDALKVQHGQRFTVTQRLPNWEGTVVSLQIDVQKTSDLSVLWKRLAK